MSTNKTAHYILDDIYARSGWDFDLRGAEKSMPAFFWQIKEVESKNNGYPCVGKRDVNPRSEGVYTFETTYNIKSGEGFFFAFTDRENAFVKIVQKDGFFFAQDKKLFPISYGAHYIRIDLDLDNKKAYFLSDGINKAVCDFMGNTNTLSQFKFGYDGDTIGSAHLDGPVKLYTNYLVNDYCLYTFEGEMPVDYIVNAPEDTRVHRIKYSDVKNLHVYNMSSNGKNTCSVKRPFNKTSGKVELELRYHQNEENCGKFTVKFNNGDTTAVSVYDKDYALYCDGGMLKQHNNYVWQTLRVQIDTNASTALINLNGKKVSVIALENAVDAVDSFEVCFESNGESNVHFSDMRVYPVLDEPCDYVPEPIIPKKKGDYKVGMLTCSLWREGHHYGWDCITPFYEDHTPLMGWFEEGNPETNDWEIKWMAEHGVDFQLYCWYANESDRAFKQTRMSFALYDGHLHAKYADKVKIALLWEAGNSPIPKNREMFRNQYVKHWIDYFFSDDRYMRIDNKAVMSVFGANKLVEAFGSPAGVKEELDYLRSEVKKLGYDDLIILYTGGSSVPQYNECGFDGIHAYTWGSNGYDVDFTKDCMNKILAKNDIHLVPTVSQGYNLVAWTGSRTPSTTPEDFKTLLEWSKDEILSKYEKDSWKSKLMILSTWNEFGEGTYINPSNLYGMGYLDAVRSVFTEDTPHTDIVPTQNQKDRINNIYVKDRRTIAPLDSKGADLNDYGVYKRYEFKTQEDLDKWEFHGFSSLEIKDGILYGHSDQHDPYMLLKDSDFMPFSASRVLRIRTHIRAYKPVNQMCCVQLAFSTEKDGSFPMAYGNLRQVYSVTDPDNIVEINLEVRRIRGWKWQDKITAIRFDPIYAVGDFELVDIEFMASAATHDFVVDGVPLTMAQDIYEEDGQIYIPFDTTSNLRATVGMYYEWIAPKQQLVIHGQNKDDYIFTKDSDIVLCGDNTIKMSKPLTFNDGIPAIPAKLLAEIMGRKLIITEDTVSIEK